MIDFDYNATTPLKKPVKEAMEPFLNGKHGNPSSLHQIGQETKASVEEARETIAEALDTNPETLTITASGSEANTLAIRGVIRPPYEDRTVITTPVEHSSVKDTIDWLEERGTTVHRTPIDRNGQIDLDWFESHIGPSVDLVSVMSVNNETGVRFPIDRIGQICQSRDVLFHSDMVQAFGKIEISYQDLPVDLFSVSAHKIGGPKGAGALIAPRSIKLEPLIFGGHQERDRRGGTENVPALVGFGEASSRVNPHLFQETADIRDRLEERVTDRIDDSIVVGRSTKRVGNTSGFLFRGIEGEDVVMRLDMKGIAVATGSACTSGSPQPSHVISSMELPGGYQSDSFVRISLPPRPSGNKVEQLVDLLSSCVDTLREKTFV